MMKKSNNFCTIEGFESMTAQEIFTMSATHLLKQGKRSTFGEDEGTCQYLTNSGLMCAAGVFIDSQKYTKSLEGVTWSNLAVIGKVPNYHVNLIRGLQQIHDVYDPHSWRDMLTALAAEHNLEMPYTGCLYSCLCVCGRKELPHVL